MKDIALWNIGKAPLVQGLKAVTPPVVWQFLYRRLVAGSIPDAERYAPFYSPWLEPQFDALYRIVGQRTLCPRPSCWYLSALLRQCLRLDGAVYEAGVYRGGTARLLREQMAASGKMLRLFDTFAGMQTVDAGRDRFRAGDFADTSLDSVRAFVGPAEWIDFRPGWIPATLGGLEDEPVCFAHVDLDLYQPILDFCQFVYPKLRPGGAIVFDDYGYASCPGARKAVDEFFATRPEVPLALQTGQAIVIKA